MHGDSLVSTDGKVHGSDEGIKLGYNDGKVLGAIFGNVDGNILGLDFGTDLGSLYGSFDGSNDDKLEGLFLGDSLRYTAGKLHSSDEGLKMVCTDGKLFVTIPVNVDRITLGLDIGTNLVSLDGSFDGSNDGKLEGLLIGYAMGYIDGKLLGSDGGIKLGSTDGKVFTLVPNIQIPLTPATEQLRLP